MVNFQAKKKKKIPLEISPCVKKKEEASSCLIQELLLQFPNFTDEQRH